MAFRYSIEVLSKQHCKEAFSCGIHALDRYLHQQATQDARRHIAATFVLIENASQDIVGYYTLSSTSIEVNKLPIELIRKLPKYPFVPATLLGRLAVDKNYQGKKLGELLLVDALKKSLKLSHEIASMAVMVEAKDDRAIKFYQHYGFIQLPQTLHKLFLPMTTIAKVWHED